MFLEGLDSYQLQRKISFWLGQLLVDSWLPCIRLRVSMADMQRKVPEESLKVDDVLQEHRKEMLEKLNLWLHRVEAMLYEHLHNQPAPKDGEAMVMGRNLSITFDGNKVCRKRSAGLGDQVQSSETSDLGDGGTDSADLARIISQQKEAAAQEVEMTSVEDSETPRSSWERLRSSAKVLVTSHVSNAFFALVVLSNSIYLGVQLEYHAVVKDSSADALFLYIHLVYAVLFTIEVGLRLLADGFFKYFCSAEWAWNILDVFIVSSSWIELIVDVLTPGNPETPNRGTNTNLRLIRLLRVGRLFRVVRIIRVVRLFRSLRTLVQSLVGTLKTLFWALLLLFLIMHLVSHKDIVPLELPFHHC